MNTLIDNLAQECKEESYSFSERWGNQRHSYFNREKFAKMIIEECIKLNSEELSFAAHANMVEKYYEHFGLK